MPTPTLTEGAANYKGVATITDNGDGTGYLNIGVVIDPGTSAASLGKAEDAAHSSGDVGIMGLTVRKDTPVATAGAAGDYQPAITDANGHLWTRAKHDGVTWTPVRANLSSTDASTAADLSAAPTSGQKIVIDDWFFSAAVAMRVDLIEETSGTVLHSGYVPANSSFSYSPKGGLKADTADKKIRVQTSVAGACRGTLLYHSEA